MTVNEKRASGKATAVLSIINLCLFLLYYTSGYIVRSTALDYATFYVSEAAEAVLPISAAAAMLISYSVSGYGKALLRALPYTLVRAIHLFPYYAFVYAYDGYEITGVLALSALESLFMLVVLYIKTVVLFLIMIFIARIKDPGYDVGKALTKRAPFDFDVPLTRGIFASAAVVFVYNLVLEVIDTVAYLTDYMGTYRTGEIIYMVCKYIFILALLFISHLAAHYTKYYLSKRYGTNK